MTTYNDLVELERAIGDEQVLSVYVSLSEKDPAQRQRWQIDLKNSLDEVEASLAGQSHAAREAFARSRETALAKVAEARGVIRSPGWAGFFVGAREYHAGGLEAPVRTFAAWDTGPRLTPYVRALKESRPVILALLDKRHGRIFKYVNRAIELVESLSADADIDHPYHMSAQPRPGFHPGTRGSPGADEVERELLDAMKRMLLSLSEKITKVASDDAWIVFGGMKNVVHEAFARLPKALGPRAIIVEGLDVRSSESMIAGVARQSASTLRDRLDLEIVTEALDGAASNGLGAVGIKDVMQALEQGRVRDVYFTLRFLEQHPREAEDALRMALGTRAVVEHVSGDAALKLDEAGGVTARLRYTLNQRLAREAGRRGGTGDDARLERVAQRAREAR